MPTVLSVFTGAGGLDLGLEAAGFRTLVCIERHETARATVKQNRPDWRFIEPNDVSEVDVAALQRAGVRPRRTIDILAAGPPCQPFSKAAQWSERHRPGLADPRSKCIHGLMTLIRTVLPKVVLVENVRGFAHGRHAALPFVERSLEQINNEHGTRYCVGCRMVNAVDYGVPQRRERAILVIRRDGLPFDWPEPTHAEQPVRAWDAIGRLRSRQGDPKPQGKWADLLPSIPEGHNYLWHTDRGGGRPLFGYRTRYWSFLLKLAKSEPAWTLPAQPGPANGPFHWDNRPLSVPEMLRLQSFPADWKVEGDYRSQVLQVGNATPPLLSEVIGRAIGEQVFGLRYACPPALSIRRRRKIPSPNPVRRVSRKYMSLEGEHPSHPGTGQGPKPLKKGEAA